MPQNITLLAAGAIPGIPGIHAPGSYTIDYDARTIEPVSATPNNDVASLEAEIADLQAEVAHISDAQPGADVQSPS